MQIDKAQYNRWSASDSAEEILALDRAASTKSRRNEETKPSVE